MKVVEVKDDEKIATIILSLLVCTMLFTGCGNSSKSSQVQSLKVYSFSGNSESISVSNGVIVLAGKDEICYGGNLKVKMILLILPHIPPPFMLMARKTPFYFPMQLPIKQAGQ